MHEKHCPLEEMFSGFHSNKVPKILLKPLFKKKKYLSLFLFLLLYHTSYMFICNEYICFLAPGPGEGTSSGETPQPPRKKRARVDPTVESVCALLSSFSVKCPTKKNENCCCNNAALSLCAL